MLDKHRNQKRLENLNREIKMERKRKNLVERSNELKSEQKNILLAISNFHKELEQLSIDIEFLDKFDEFVGVQDSVKDNNKYSKNLERKFSKKTLNDADAEFMKNRNIINVNAKFLFLAKSL